MKKLLGAVTFGQRVALGAAALLGLLLLAFVDLSPKVEGDFFFSSDDPQIQASRRIETTFRDDPQILVAVRAPRLFSRAALVRTFALTEDLASIDGVTGVYSVTHGPQETHDVAELDPDEVREEIVESPFWRRLLLSPDRKICFLVLVLDEKSTNEDEPRRHLIEAIDAAIDRHEARDFELAASGVPYVAEHIRADLTRDLKTFTIAAIVAFTALLWLLFRSAAAVFGTLTAALSACFATFLIRAAFGMSTGILTPNLWIIAFVLTLSHVVFLTASYGRQAAAPAEKEPLAAAVRQTGPASAWSLAANLCGFASLIFVEAKPLRDFGISGAIASAAALAAAYLVYPPFLAAVPPPAETGGLHRAGERFFLHRHRFLAALLIVVAFALVPFSRKVDTDPSLPSYLASGSEVRTGLEAIDRSGGSSTLELAVRDARGGALADKESFERLRALQADLEKHPDVGSVVSVALLMEELQRPWYSFLFSWEKRVEALEERDRARIARTFLDESHVLGRFILRMHEETRNRPRAAIIAEVEAIVRKHGFDAAITGGAFSLQSALSELVHTSVVRGLGGLLVLFFVITLVTSRSPRAAVTMTLCLGVVPITLYGIVGLTGMRLDIISAPAANVALPMGIDEMIHLAYAVRRVRGGARGVGSDWSDWRQALEELWRPTVASMLVVAAGFSLFLVSRFPPSQHLGILVCVGAVLTDLAVLVVLPATATVKVSPRILRARARA